MSLHADAVCAGHLYRPASPDALRRRKTSFSFRQQWLQLSRLPPAVGLGWHQQLTTPPHSTDYAFTIMGLKISYTGMKRKEIFVATGEECKERRAGIKIKMGAYLTLNQTYANPPCPLKLGGFLQCSSRWLGTPYVDQASLRLTDINLPLPHEYATTPGPQCP